MDKEKHSNLKEGSIKRGSIINAWYQNVALWNHFSKMAFDTQTFGNF
jgi:hypothetical protein